jgi:hypothetical protein
MGVSLTRLVKWMRVIRFSSLLFLARRISNVEYPVFYSKTEVLLIQCYFPGFPLSFYFYSLLLKLLNSQLNLSKTRQINRTNVSPLKHLPQNND